MTRPKTPIVLETLFALVVTASLATEAHAAADPASAVGGVHAPTQEEQSAPVAAPRAESETESEPGAEAVVAAPPVSSAPAPAATESHPLETRWRTSLYGFAELDGMHDTTESYGPAANNTVLARPGRPDNYAWHHGRTQFTVNNSLIGLRVAAPEYRRMKASGQVEVDFFGVQPTDATEQTAFTAPSIRLRLFYLKLETPVVDVLAGQYHDLFGWGGAGFYQNSVAFLGVGGEIYHRNPQIRLSKTFTGAGASLDIAAAAVRPVQRDSELPDIEGGIKLSLSSWKGANAQGFGQPGIAPLAIGISGVGRRFAVAEFLTSPGDPRVAYGWGVAVNAFLPVIPAHSADEMGNALSVMAEASVGTGISDLYTGLTGGALFPLLPDPSGVITPPPIYRPNIDNGIVTYDANSNLKAINWRSLVVGLQYYLPIDEGRVWVSATASRLESNNLRLLTPEGGRGAIFTQQDYLDGNLFVELTPACEVGLSYQVTQQVFGDFPFAEAPPAVPAHPEQRNQRAEVGLRMFF
jgi:hypothetical protein